MQPDVFFHRSVIAAPAADVFSWHERPEALRDLLPSLPFLRIDEQSGGVREGGRVVLSFGVGPFRGAWEARHYGYVAGVQFCDEQVRGPFRCWRHTHRVEPRDATTSILEDRVEFALPGGRLLNRLVRPFLHFALRRAFRQRHAVVRAAFPGRASIVRPAKIVWASAQDCASAASLIGKARRAQRR